MRAAYARGENAMEYARQAGSSLENSPSAILIAYDLQAGSYAAHARTHSDENARWCTQLAQVLTPMVTADSSILEVGCGEATTLAGVLKRLAVAPRLAMGFDISWSRCAEGNAWLSDQHAAARLFVADLFEIPLADASIDVVYTSHSIEPNGGREEAALREVLRIARRAVVLVEPIYELASERAQARMRHHGYVRGLKETVERLGGNVVEYGLLPRTANPLNPSGLIRVEMPAVVRDAEAAPELQLPGPTFWRCPLTHAPLDDLGDAFASSDTGVAYPVLRGIPLLRVEHAVVASGLRGALGDASS
jgi:ubiquinone/menaquinone biosynthesis C-methylase UbiE